MDILERFNGFDDSTCWQYSIRKKNEKSDIEESNLNIEILSSLRVSDFTFHHVPKEDKDMVIAIKKPIDKNQTSADAGLEVMKATLTQLGVNPASYIIVDRELYLHLFINLIHYLWLEKGRMNRWGKIRLSRQDR